MVFAWYFIVTCQTRAWAHIIGMIIAAFLNPGVESGEWGGGVTSPHRPSPLFFLHTLPSFSQHMDAGVPVMISRCLSSARALTKTYLSSSKCSHSLSQATMHTPSLFPAAHCLVKETLPWPWNLPWYNPFKTASYTVDTWPSSPFGLWWWCLSLNAYKYSHTAQASSLYFFKCSHASTESHLLVPGCV